MRRNGQKSQDRRPIPRALLSWLLLDCETVLLRKRATALLRHPQKPYTRFASIRFLRVR